VPLVNGQIADQLRSQGVLGLIDSSHPDYDAARRVWNADIDRRPALIVRCSGVADVMAAVNTAREARLSVAIRGGGHNAAGHATCEGGMVIDLTPMKGIWVAPDDKLAVAQAGVLWREFDRETQAFGLAAPGGMVSNTGIAGLTLGGGLGWLMGKYGLTVDNVLGVDLVTAMGSLLRADPHTNADLFWAVRGGGGNFGVVTRIEYRLHALGPMVYGGLLAFPLAQGREVLRFYREVSAGLPDEAEMHAGILTVLNVGPVAALLLGFNGDPAVGEHYFRTVLAFGKPAVSMVGPMPHIARQCMLDRPYADYGRMRYWKSGSSEVLSDEFIELLIEAGRTLSSPESAILVFRLHGAAARVPIEATACPLRGERWDINMIAQWSVAAESDHHKAWARDFWQGLEPLLSGAAYMNHLAADDGLERVRASFGANFERLTAIKTRYDPDNLFHLNPNIRPG
jgi:FAD/FMN-containing dehydrogenase